MTEIEGFEVPDDLKKKAEMFPTYLASQLWILCQRMWDTKVKLCSKV